MDSRTMRCELVSWEQFTGLTRELAMAVLSSGFKADIIVAIGRGGYMPARLLSDYLDIFNLTSFKIEHYRRTEKSPDTIVRYPLSADLSGLKVLLVDDVSDGGDTFTIAASHLHEKGPPAEIRTAVLHHKVQSLVVPDFYAAEVIEWHWLIYPWAVLEDVSGFIQTMKLDEATPAELRSSIKQTYGVTIPDQTLLDAQAVARRFELKAS